MSPEECEEHLNTGIPSTTWKRLEAFARKDSPQDNVLITFSAEQSISPFLIALAHALHGNNFAEYIHRHVAPQHPLDCNDETVRETLADFLNTRSSNRVRIDERKLHVALSPEDAAAMVKIHQRQHQKRLNSALDEQGLDELLETVRRMVSPDRTLARANTVDRSSQLGHTTFMAVSALASMMKSHDLLEEPKPRVPVGEYFFSNQLSLETKAKIRAIVDDFLHGDGHIEPEELRFLKALRPVFVQEIESKLADARDMPFP